MPDLKSNDLNNKLIEIILTDATEAKKITLLKEEFVKNPLDPTSKDAANLLHRVIVHGSNEIFLFLISEMHIDINLRSITKNKRTPFANAALYGHISILKELAKRGADTTSPDANGNYPLHLASDADHHETVKYLISECNASVNQITNNESKATALHFAVFFNKSDKTLKELIKLGADYQSPFREGRYPLHLAIEKGNLEIIKYLIQECKVDVNQKINDQFGTTPFQHAVTYNQLEALKTLLELKADHQLCNLKGATSLSHIQSEIKMEIFIFLVDKLNHHELWTSSGLHGIHLAAMYNLPKMIEYLVKEKKVDVNLLAKSESGSTAFYIGVQYKSIRALKKLVELGANYQLPNKKGFYPIHATEDNDTLEYLVNELHVDINQKSSNEYQQTALLEAIQFDYPEAFEKLLELKADINIPDKKGHYPLHVAAIYGRSKMTQSLLNIEGIKINQTFVNGNPESTPLSQALFNQYIGTTRILLEHNGSITSGSDKFATLKNTFNAVTRDNKKKNEALILLAMHDSSYRVPLLKLAIEKNFTWLSMALYDPAFSDSMVTWSKTTSTDQLSLLHCIAAHDDFKKFYTLMDAKNCPKTLSHIINHDEFKALTESKREFLKTKNSMYYEILHVEEIAKTIQKILYKKIIFLKLPTVLFDLVFDFVADHSLCKTKPSAILKAMSTSSKQNKTDELKAPHALFFKKLTPKTSTNIDRKKTPTCSPS